MLGRDVYFPREGTNEYLQNEEFTVKCSKTVALKKAKLYGIRKDISQFQGSSFYVTSAEPRGLGH